MGTGAFHDHGIVQEATRFIKRTILKSLSLRIHVFVNIQAMVIVEMIEGDKILNDASLEVIGRKQL